MKFTAIPALIVLLFSVITGAQTWKTLTTSNGLSDNQIRCITGDSTGTVWFGTRTKGVQGYNGSAFINFPNNSSFPVSGGGITEITGIGIIDNKMYIGVKSTALTGYGLYVYNFAGSTMTYIGPLTILGSQDIRVFHKSKSGQIYAGASDGFYKRIADNNWAKIGYGYVQTIAERSDGLIYYTTYDSLFQYDGTVKKGIKKGFFYSVAFDGNDVCYVSTISEVFRLQDTNLVSLGLTGYSKWMAKDKNGKVWIASAGTGSFGLASVSGSTVTTYTTTNSPLLSTDMTAVYVNADNSKYIGHYSAGMNVLSDAIITLPVQITPTTATILNGQQQVFSAANGIRPYKWWVSPAALGTIDTAGTNGTFRAQKSGKGYIYVTGANGADTAKASITVVDTGVYPKLPPTSFVATKGRYADKIQLSWVPPGEFNEGFEDGLPPDWKTVYTGTDTTLWVESGFAPHSGTKCYKFDVYSPGTPETAWMMTRKLRITPEKTKLNLYFKTAYALGNPHSSYIKLSSTDNAPASFTTTLKELAPSFLSDSTLQWRRLMIDLSAYINQDVYIGFQCKAEDIIIYFDDLELTGQAGLNGIAQRVRSYILYRSETPSNVGASNTAIQNALITSYNDSNILPLRNYYYAVKAVYDSGLTSVLSPVNFGVAYSQSDSIVLGPASTVTPVADGVINPAEYAGAAKLILARNGYFGDVYLKVAGGKLFLAYDMIGDTSLTDGDFVLFAFDKERNYAYTDSLEGYFRVQKMASGIELSFFPFYALSGFTTGRLNPAGLTGNVSKTNGHVQFEMAVDLQTSMLNLPQTAKIGAYLGAYDARTGAYPGWLERLLAKEYSVAGFGSITISKIVNTENETAPPAEFSLEQNYPNPFNPSTKIRYSIPKDGFVTLKVYDVLGGEVATLVNAPQQSGAYSLEFDASHLSSGVYMYKLTSGNVSLSRKMIITK